MAISRDRQHAEEMFKRIQKPPVGSADRCDSRSGRQNQSAKTARLRELRLAQEAIERPRSDHDKSSR
jgi:hypothetical protein